MKLGKTQARPGAVSFKLTDYISLPKPPATFGHYRLVVSNWGMLGNDDYGDCVWAGAGHETMLWNREAAKTVTFTDDEVLSYYSAVTGFKKDDPSTDQGTDMQVAASYRRKTGVVAKDKRHQVLAYLALEVGNTTQLKQAVYLFSAVGLGINFPSSAMDQFNAGEPWDVVKGSKIEGGHYVPIVGYDSKYFYVITWGKVQKATYAFVQKYMDEGLAYCESEMLTNNKSLEGFNLSQLETDLKGL